MAEDGDWADGLWSIRGRLVLVAIYGAKDLGKSEGKTPPRNHALDAYKRLARQECPDWDLRDGECLPVLEDIAMPMPGRGPHLNKSWALMMLPKGLSNEAFLRPKNRYSGKRGDHMVLFQEFPWELPGVQAYQIFGVQSTVMNEKMVEVIQGKLGTKLLGSPQVKSRVNPTTCQKVWEVTLNFTKSHEEDGQQVMGTIPVSEREWVQAGQKWSIRNGVHCMGCHGQGHQISDCLLAPYMAPYDLKLPTRRLGPGGGRRPFFDPASRSGTRDA